MINLPVQAQIIVDMLEKFGFQIYAVGGSVRDILMKRPTKGWDFTTNATPEEILSLFPDSFYDNQFGTVGIKIYSAASLKLRASGNDSIKPDDIYEITTYRSEKGYSDRRHPDTITWGKTVQEDISRRDFTINAIAYDGNTFIDPYDGQKDVDAKIIKAVGDPNSRFSEDALRMMRAVRQASELGFTIEESTLRAIKTNASLITSVSQERIRDELVRLLSSDYASDGILILHTTGLLKIILPELDATFDIEQKSPKRHHMFDVGTHSVLALKHCPSNDPIVRLATLLHDIGKPKTYNKDETGLITFFNHEVAGANLTRTIAGRLRFSKADTYKLITLVRWHQFSVDENQTDSAIRRFIRRVGKENLGDILALRIGDRLGGGARETSWRLELYKKRLAEVQIQPFSVSDLPIDGHDVMSILQVKPGPIVGETLDNLFALVESGSVKNDRETLLDKLNEIKTHPQETIK